METPLKVSEKSPDGMDIITPPPAKKLKQARLPFKVLSPKPVLQASPSPNTKKRKLSDSGTPQQKAPKAQRNEELSKKNVRNDDAENEVSSSSEAEVVKVGVKGNSGSRKSKSCLLDTFVRKEQQGEVSTSCENGVIDITDDVQSTEVVSSVIESVPGKGDKENDGDQSNVSKSNLIKNHEVQKQGQKTENVGSASLPSKTRSENEVMPEKLKQDDEATQSADEMEVSMLSDNGDEDESTLDEGHHSMVENENSGADSSLDVSCSTPKTPKMEPKQKTRSKTPGSLKKQAEKDTEKMKKKEEREKQRLEKLKQKEEEKKKKEQQKQEEKDRKEKERLEMKQKKEKEKLEKEEQKKKEREDKERLKEEERMKKMEIVEARNEEKRKKDEEKRKKEDEKKKLEEEGTRKKQKIQSAFKSFFNKTENSPKQEVEVQGPFIAFQVKKDMRLAPAVRVDLALLHDRMKELDVLMKQGNTSVLYLDKLRSRNVQPGRSGKTFPFESADSDLECTDDIKPLPFMKAKFLKFRENYRPAYYGTWRKKSKHVNPRNPLKKDEVLLDYEVDSDDEWEEEEPGESLSDSEGEGDDDDDTKVENDDDGDGFFVPHGYLSDDEGCEEEEQEEANPEHKKIRQMMKMKAWETDMKHKCEVLKPVCVGCCWWGPDTVIDPMIEKLRQYQMVLMTDSPIRVDKTDPKGEEKDRHGEESKKLKIKPVPEEAMPDLIRLVHGNTISMQKIIKEFREFWRLKENQGSSPECESLPVDLNESGNRPSTPSSSSPGGGNKCSISKRQLDMKIKSIASYEKRDGFKRNCWYVQQSLLEQYNLTDLPVPCKWDWLTRPAPPQKPVEPNPVPPQPAKVGHATPTIKKFTVANMSPQILSPSPVRLKSQSSESGTPKSTASTPKSSKTPVVLVESSPKRTLSDKSINPAILFFKPRIPSGGAKEEKKTVTPTPPSFNNPIIINDNDDNDCMIVDTPMVLQPVDKKTQPTVLSLFSSNRSKEKNNAKNEDQVKNIEDEVMEH